LLINASDSPVFPIAENKLEKKSIQEEPLSREILQDLSFSVQPVNCSIGGTKWSGEKRRLRICFLASMMSNGGSIEAGWVDIRSIALDSLQSLIGSVTQETYLFHSSGAR